MIHARIAGASVGQRGHVDGSLNRSRFDRPHDIALNLDSTKLYIADHGNNAIRVFDMDTHQVDTLVTLDTGPHNLALHDGTLYVSGHNNYHHPYQSEVYTINPDTGAILTTVDVSNPGYDHLAIDPHYDRRDASATGWAGAVIPNVDTADNAEPVVLMKYPLRNGPSGFYTNGWFTFGEPGNISPGGPGDTANTGALVNGQCVEGPVGEANYHLDGHYAGASGGVTIHTPATKFTVYGMHYVYPSYTGYAITMTTLEGDIGPHKSEPWARDAINAPCLHANTAHPQGWARGCTLGPDDWVHGTRLLHSNAPAGNRGHLHRGGWTGYNSWQWCATVTRPGSPADEQLGTGHLEVHTSPWFHGVHPEYWAVGALNRTATGPVQYLGGWFPFAGLIVLPAKGIAQLPDETFLLSTSPDMAAATDGTNLHQLHMLSTRSVPFYPGFDPAHLTVNVDWRTLDTGHVELVGGALEVAEPVPARITLGPAVSGPVTNGPLVRAADAPPPQQVTARVFRHPDHRTPVRTLTGMSGWEWQDRLNEAGNGSVEIPNHHPDRDYLEPDDLIRFEVEGRAAFTVALTDDDSVTGRADGQDAQRTTFTGPGVAGLLSEMIVMPSNGAGSVPVEIDRVFGWMSPSFNDAQWPATRMMSMYGDHPASNEGWWHQMDAAWPDPSATWLWGTPGTARYAPEGYCYFRQTFTILASADVEATVYATVDNGGDLYLDGQLIIGGMDNFTRVWTEPVTLSPGEHLVAVLGANAPFPEGAVGNPAGVIWSIYERNEADGTVGVVLAHSNATAKVLSYPVTPPGMTPGAVLEVIFDEAQALGVLEGWELTFNAVVDSDGNPWAQVGEITTKVGTDYRTFILDEMAQTYIDVRAQPAGLVLDAYQRDGLGQVRDFDLHAAVDAGDPRSGNVTEINHARRAVTATGFLVRWQGGWRLVNRDTTGRKKLSVLGLGALPSTHEVDRVTQAQLTRYSDVRQSITAGFVPQTVNDTPYAGWFVGDTITVPDRDGNPVAERVLGLSVTPNESGDAVFSPELRDVIAQSHERWEETLKKMADGTVRGDSKVAQPISTVDTRKGPNCCPPTPVTWTLTFTGGTSEAYNNYAQYDLAAHPEGVTVISVTASLNLVADESAILGVGLTGQKVSDPEAAFEGQWGEGGYAALPVHPTRDEVRNLKGHVTLDSAHWGPVPYDPGWPGNVPDEGWLPALGGTPPLPETVLPPSSGPFIAWVWLSGDLGEPWSGSVTFTFAQPGTSVVVPWLEV